MSARDFQLSCRHVTMASRIDAPAKCELRNVIRFLQAEWPKKNEIGLSDPSLSCYQENRALARRRPLAKHLPKISVFSSLAPPFYSLVLLLGERSRKTFPQIHVHFVSGAHLSEPLLAPYLFWACPSVASGFSCSR
ncbi:hypothetical protein AVEN_69081-1 [Araneus ventricosus]|uniref:Uncharacterized protein n=1 Tax=Araneus ventricosus TaxID=182803 RepID=A0A4Y2QGJ7_ARAVE|nr:hypothetical protein AVEN_69081-1 [Araneus ventricosus]